MNRPLIALLLLAFFLAGGAPCAEDGGWRELNAAAERLAGEGKYREALEPARRALAAAKAAFGDGHPKTALSLHNLGAVCFWLGSYAEAEERYVEALRVRLEALGPRHPDVAATLSNLGLLYDTLGRFGDAELVYSKALVIREGAYGPDHIEVGASLNNLALLYDSQGRYAEAEPLYLRALSIAEKRIGPESRQVAATLNNLGLLYDNLGRVGEAERLYVRSLAVKERVLGPSHPGLVPALANLASLYRCRGLYARAEELYGRALAIELAALGPKHPDCAVTLNNLAVLYKVQGRLDEARRCYESALAVLRSAFGGDHPLVAAALSNEGNLDLAEGRVEEARTAYLQAKAVYERLQGPDSPDVALCLNNLGNLLVGRGDYDQAAPHYEKALVITRRALGARHPETAVTLKNLAFLEAARGRWGEALPLLQEALAADDLLIAAVFPLASERDKFAFLGTAYADYESFLSLALSARPSCPAAAGAALDAVLRRKGLVVEALSRERDSLFTGETGEVRKLFERYQYVCARLSSLALGGPGGADPARYRGALEAMEEEREALDRELTERSAARAPGAALASAGGAQAASALPADGALVEYACVSLCDFRARAGAGRWRAPHYLAFVVRPGGEGREAIVEMADLGEASRIDEAVADFRGEIAQGRSELRAGVFSEEEASARLAEKSGRLYGLLFAPLEAPLKGCRTLVLSPDGELNLLPFEALCGPDGRFLVESRSVSYVSCGRDLAAPRGAPSSGEAVIVADPDYRLVAGAGGGAAAERSRDLASTTWKPLPGTRAEADAVRCLLKGRGVRLLTGADATEEAVKKLRSPALLHIATHGFFLDDQAEDAWLHPGAPEANEGLTLEALRMENPLLRAGLVLAGANRLKNVDRADDGVLTALEISGMCLRGTDLVVLSACETGLGKARRGEGVFGLRRAFQLAGARTVVMSLWSVPDAETAELMELFYRARAGGAGKAQALVEAKRALIAERRAAHGAAHPFFWAAFLCAGGSQ